MKRKYVCGLLIFLLLAFTVAGCAKDEPAENNNVESDVEADVNSDADVESDTDVEEDTDVEADTDAEVDTEVDTETDADTDVTDGEIDLEALFQQGMDSYTEKGMEPPVLFPEFDIEYLENFYPGIGYAKIKQIYIAMAPVTNAPMEIALVEVEDSSDVAAIRDIFQERIDARANDSAYPEESAVWKKNGIVTIRDNYIFMAVMTDDYGIPDVFILD